MIFIFTLAGILLVVLRMPVFSTPFLSMDETEYGLAGMSLLQGGVPYRDFVIHHPPLIYFLYAASFVLGRPWDLFAIKVIFSSLVFLTAGMVYGIGREMAPHQDRRKVALWGIAAVLLPYHSFVAKDFLAANCEILVNFFLTGCFWCWLKAKKEICLLKGWILLSGVCFGAAMLSKLQALFFIPACLGFFVHQKSARNLGIFLVGVAAVVLGIGGWLWAQGARELFVHEMLVHSFRYVFSGKNAAFLSGSDVLYYALKISFRFSLIGICLWPWVYGAMRRSEFSTGLYAERQILKLWLFAQGVGVLLGGRLFWHYFLLLIPPLVLLGFSFFLQRIRRLSWGILAVLIFQTMAWAKPGYAAGADVQVLAPWIKAHSQPAERILLWGFAPQVYFFAQRFPATRYFHSDPLSGKSRKSRGQNLLQFTGWQRFKADFVNPMANQFDPNLESAVCDCVWRNVRQDILYHPPRWIIDVSSIAGRGYENRPLAGVKELLELLGDPQPARVVVNTFVFYVQEDDIPEALY